MIPRVSDHALLRYIERVLKLDVEAVRRRMLTEKVKAAIEAGASTVKVEGFRFAVKDGAVATVMPKRVKPKVKRKGRVSSKPRPNGEDEIAEQITEGP